MEILFAIRVCLDFIKLLEHVRMIVLHSTATEIQTTDQDILVSTLFFEIHTLVMEQDLNRS